MSIIKKKKQEYHYNIYRVFHGELTLPIQILETNQTIFIKIDIQ